MSEINFPDLRRWRLAAADTRPSAINAVVGASQNSDTHNAHIIGKQTINIGMWCINNNNIIINETFVCNIVVFFLSFGCVVYVFIL